MSDERKTQKKLTLKKFYKKNWVLGVSWVSIWNIGWVKLHLLFSGYKLFLFSAHCFKIIKLHFPLGHYKKFRLSWVYMKMKKLT